MTLADTRAAMNELIEVAQAESAARIAADDRIERLIGVDGSGGSLYWALAAIVASTVFGGVGDFASTLNWNPFFS